MFNRTQDESKLNIEIDRVLTQMHGIEPESDEYTELLAKLERLVELTDDNHVRKPISLDTLVLAGVELSAVLIVVIFEQKHVWTSKALGVVKRTK